MSCLNHLSYDHPRSGWECCISRRQNRMQTPKLRSLLPPLPPPGVCDVFTPRLKSLVFNTLPSKSFNISSCARLSANLMKTRNFGVGGGGCARPSYFNAGGSCAKLDGEKMGIDTKRRTGQDQRAVDGGITETNAAREARTPWLQPLIRASRRIDRLNSSPIEQACRVFSTATSMRHKPDLAI